MANDLNLCQFIGRLGKPPESKATPSGLTVTNFSIACGWKSKDKEGTEWVNITAFGKLADICAQYLDKGSQVYIAGSLKNESWEKDGQKHYRTYIVADKMQMLGGKSESTGSHQAANNFHAPADSGADSGEPDWDRDLPF